MRKQEHDGALAGATSRALFWSRRCRVAFVATASALRKRPASKWYEVARTDGSVADPGASAVEFSQLAIRTAIRSGDRAAIRATAQHVADYFDTLKAAALYEVPADPEMDPRTLSLVLNKEGHEALAAMTEAELIPCESRRARAIREVSEALDAGAKWVKAMTIGQPREHRTQHA